MKVTNEQIIEALDRCYGIQSEASRRLNITRSALSQRIASSPNLQEHLNDLREAQIDKAEFKLMQRIENNQDVKCILFLLRTRGKSRGYSEKPDPVKDDWDDVIRGFTEP